jgi:hypothetical protein
MTAMARKTGICHLALNGDSYINCRRHNALGAPLCTTLLEVLRKIGFVDVQLIYQAYLPLTLCAIVIVAKRVQNYKHR